MPDQQAKKSLLTRLRRVEGQLAAICRMVDDDQLCVDILLQIAAARGALGKAGQVLLGSHVETCVSEAFSSGSPQERETAIEELMEVFARYSGIGGR